MSNGSKTFKKNSIESVEVIIFIISDLIDTILTDHYESSQFEVIEAFDNIFKIDFFPIIFILTICQLIIMINFVDITIMT